MAGSRSARWPVEAVAKNLMGELYSKAEAKSSQSYGRGHLLRPDVNKEKENV